MLDAKRRCLLDAMGIPLWQTRETGGMEQLASVTTGLSVIDEPPSPAHWPAFENKLRTCQQCPLHLTRQHVVIGEGARQASLCIIGVAPDSDEDTLGKPFVGKAGQLLTEMLSAIGLARAEVYITQVVKCRPAENCRPNAKEMATCSPFLLQELAWIQPKVILLLGDAAAHALLETSEPISTLRQGSFTFSPAKYPVVVTYHPATLLQTPSDKAKVLDDLWRVKALLS